MDKYLKSARIFEQTKEKFFNINKDNPSFRFFQGEKPGIIFSCPHAVQQIREGKEKLADIFTGPLGMALNKLGYSVLIKTNTFNDDANYDLKSPYKLSLSKIITEQNIKFLIDIHGMSTKRDILISLGTCFGKNIDKNTEATRVFINSASKNNINTNLIRIDFPFSASKRTVSHYIKHKNNIETLQIEINSKIFSNSENIINLLKTLDDFCNSIFKLKNFELKEFDYQQLSSYDNKLFNQTYTRNNFTIKQSNSGILVAAPHSCSMIKEGKECYQETLSGAIALQLYEKLPINILIKTAKTNYDSSSEYLDKVANIIDKKVIKFVLELHIMNPLRSEDVVLVCNNAQTLDNNISFVSLSLKLLCTNGFKNCSVDYPFNNKNLNSTVNLIKQKLGICSIQFIVNQKIIQNETKYKKLMKVLQLIINQIDICF